MVNNSTIFSSVSQIQDNKTVAAKTAIQIPSQLSPTRNAGRDIVQNYADEPL